MGGTGSRSGQSASATSTERVAAAAEFYSSAGWREDAGYFVFHFTTWAKARAMQHWIDRSGIARRPMPKLGETREEAAEGLHDGRDGACVERPGQRGAPRLSYREPFKQRRCLVPATGWYEWQKIDSKTKQPYHFAPAAKPFAFAGVYDTWRGKGAAPDVTSFSIVTTAAAPSTAAYHDRMPVLLEESQFEDWMRLPPEAAAEMMKPYGGAIDVWAVGKDVGNVRNNRPDLMERAAAVAGGTVPNG